MTADLSGALSRALKFVDKLRAILEFVEGWEPPGGGPDRPAQPAFVYRSKRTIMVDIYKDTIAPAKPSKPDQVASCELYCEVDGTSRLPVPSAFDATVDFDGLPLNSKVRILQVDVGKNGKRSQPGQALEYAVTDQGTTGGAEDTPPDTPGAPTFVSRVKTSTDTTGTAPPGGGTPVPGASGPVPGVAGTVPGVAGTTGV